MRHLRNNGNGFKRAMSVLLNPFLGCIMRSCVDLPTGLPETRIKVKTLFNRSFSKFGKRLNHSS